MLTQEQEEYLNGGYRRKPYYHDVLRIPVKWKNDREFTLATLEKCESKAEEDVEAVVRSMSVSLQNDPEFMLDAVIVKPAVVACLPEKFRDNKDFLLGAFELNPNSLDYSEAFVEVIKDKEFAKELDSKIKEYLIALIPDPSELDQEEYEKIDDEIARINGAVARIEKLSKTSGLTCYGFMKLLRKVEMLEAEEERKKN